MKNKIEAMVRPLILHSSLYIFNFQSVGLSGFEPLTSRLSGGRSNQLSYRPLIACIVSRHQNLALVA